MGTSTKPEVLRYIGAVTRGAETREYEGRPARVVTAACSYDTNVDDVWDAITTPDRIPRWFLPVSGDLRLGGRYQLEGNAGGQILACEPPPSFAVTWEYGGQMSWLHVRLSELSDGGTRLELEHVAHVPEDFWNQYGPGAVGVGWDLALMGLGRHLATGSANDPTEIETWQTYDEAKAFVRRSIEDWCRASIAARTDPAAACQSANRTTAFYGG